MKRGGIVDKQVKEALDRLNKLREEWLERLSHLTDEDLNITADDDYWTVRKWLYRMIDHETIHLGQIVRTRRSIEPVWKAAVRWREIDRLIGALYELRGRVASELVGMVFHVMQTTMPFADHPRSITGLLEHIGNRFFTQRNPIQAPVRLNRERARPVIVAPGQQGRPCRRADGRSGVMLRQPHALQRKPIHVWRIDVLIAVDAQIAVALIIRQKNNHVGLLKSPHVAPHFISSSLASLTDQVSAAAPPPKPMVFKKSRRV